MGKWTKEPLTKKNAFCFMTNTIVGGTEVVDDVLLKARDECFKDKNHVVCDAMLNNIRVKERLQKLQNCNYPDAPANGNDHPLCGKGRSQDSKAAWYRDGAD